MDVDAPSHAIDAAEIFDKYNDPAEKAGYPDALAPSSTNKTDPSN